MSTTIHEPIKLFISYSHRDESFRELLEEQLYALKRQELVEYWHDRRIAPGEEWEGAINENLETSAIVLLLISSSFIASPYCYDIEMRRALERHERGEARVIPIIVRPADWEWASFGKLQALPKDAKPITRWDNEDEAWLNVEQGIGRVVEELNDLAVREHGRERSRPDLRATAIECLNLLYGIEEANTRVLGRIEANYVPWRNLAEDNYNSLCERCEDIRQQPIGSDEYLDTVCNDLDVDAVCKRKWYLGERLEAYNRIIDRQPSVSQDHLLVQQRLKHHVSDPELSPRQLQQAIAAAVPQLEAILERR
jgi:TIR domain